MGLRQVGALLLTYLTACAGTPRARYAERDAAEAEVAAARYELHVLTVGSGPSEPVEVAGEDFQRGMRVLARGYRPGAQLAESAHWLMEGGLQGTLLAEVERRRDLIFRLCQKHGATVEAVLATREQSGAELELLTGAEVLEVAHGADATDTFKTCA